jgi:hypothetical protein
MPQMMAFAAVADLTTIGVRNQLVTLEKSERHGQRMNA